MMRLPEGVKAVLFDMDGTLIDSMKYWRSVSQDFLSARGLPVPEELRADIRDISCRITAETYAKKLSLRLTKEEIMREYEDRMLNYYLTEVEIKPGALEYIKGLKEQGVRVCVLTASPSRIAVPALRRQGLLEEMEFVICTSDLGLSKEDPACYRIAAGRLNLPCRACAMFEDALYALRGAKAAGMRLLAIEEYYSRASREEIRALTDIYVREYAELIDE